MSHVEYCDCVPDGDWHVIDVLRTKDRGWDWTAWLTDVDPDEFQRCYNEGRKVQDRWLRIPGKHRSRDAALDALENMIATRH
jgi:hypothetical protein